MARKNNPSQENRFAKLRENPPFALVESFRNLSTNIGFADPKKDGRGRVVCVSSSLPDEGKTTVAVNLAISYAGGGERTVLVDCDMRKPNIRRYFGISGGKGIAEYLSGQAEVPEIIHGAVSNNLDVVCGFKAVPNPLLLIKNDRFPALLDTLASRYDVVILDSPPLGLVSDALEIAKSTDGIVMVARQNFSEIPPIRRTIEDIEFAGVNFLGFVLNDFTSSPGKGYYGKYKYKYKYEYRSKEKS